MTDRPSTCKNPHVDCYRSPDVEARWSEDFTSEQPHNQMWLCDQCCEMLKRGSVISPNELSVKRHGFESDW
jgi:hypothetical protein